MVLALTRRALGYLPAKLHPEQVKDFLYQFRQRSNTPSQTYFKHTVYGLRFLLKTEGLPYHHLHLPSIPKQHKLLVLPSRLEVWAMLTHAQSLKHKILIGPLYGCGLRFMEVRNIQLQHMDFDRNLLRIVQSKGNKDHHILRSAHLIRGIKKYIAAAQPKDFLFEGNGNPQGKGFDGTYSQRCVQRAVKTVARQAGTFVPPIFKPLQAPVHNGCSHSRLSGHKKKALCLLVNLKTKTDNSKTSRLPKFRLIALSFLACWAKRKLSYWR